MDFKWPLVSAVGGIAANVVWYYASSASWSWIGWYVVAVLAAPVAFWPLLYSKPMKKG